MQQSKENEKNCFQWFRTKSTPSESPPFPPPENGYGEAKKQRKPGGWKTMPYIMGNETFERLASMGLTANFMIFLLTQFHLDQVTASNVISIWSSINNFGPLIGAFIADAYLGRFKTVVFASFASFAGMLTFTLIAWIPHLLPPSCKDLHLHQCTGPTSSQFLLLATALALLSIGTAGIRPCSAPFGVDQFDSSTDKGKRSIASFFNWYYLSFTVVMLISMTVVVYIQDNVSWVLGFGIPAALMLCSVLLFLAGTRLYVYVKPDGSPFTGIAQVIVAACRKRKMKMSDGDRIDDGVYYDPPVSGNAVKLPLTNNLRFLNRAAYIADGSAQADGSNPQPWRLTSIQKVEETKCLVRVIPIWASGIVCFLAIIQSGTFTVSQALTMDRRMGPHFVIPAGSLGVISMLTIAVWLPVYDRLVVPALRRSTRVEGGLTTLQRSGIGMVLTVLGMVAAGLVERKRRASALAHGGGTAPISVFWLAPPLVLMGLAEAFFIIGQTEFFNREFPENMVSLANALCSCVMALASYVSIFVVNVVHSTTGTRGSPDWLTRDINAGRVENFYFVIAGMGAVNFGYFVWVARGYQYKSKFRIDDGDNSGDKFGDFEKGR